MFRFSRPFKTSLIALGLFCQVLALGFVSPAPAVSPTLREVLLLNGGCANGASVVLNFAAGTTCGTSFGALSVTRNTVAYEDDLSGNWTAFAANTLRMTNKGLLVEESRTNSIRNNSMQGAVAGSPGTTPTNWLASASPTNGISMDVIGTGTESGIDYIDLKFSGVATTGSTFIVNFEAANQAAASSGQTWTASLFYKLVGGDYTGISSSSVQVVGTNGVSGLENGSQIFTATSAALGTQRAANIYLLANASTTNARPRLLLNYTNGSTVNITLRIGWPQLELGAFVTSPIRTTSAAATRAADAVSQTNFAFGPAYSFFAQGVPNTTSYAQNSRVLSVNAGDVSHEVAFYRPATNALGIILNGSGFGSSAWSAAARGKGAAAIAASDQAFSFNGGTVTTNAAASIPSPTQMNIGDTPASSAFWNGYIESVAIWPNTRLSNATLQALTAP